MTDFEADCMRWRGRILTGKLAHWCNDWDFLPVDETTIEIESCTCWADFERAPVQGVIDAIVLEFRKNDPTDLGGQPQEVDSDAVNPNRLPRSL